MECTYSNRYMDNVTLKDVRDINDKDINDKDIKPLQSVQRRAMRMLKGSRGSS